MKKDHEISEDFKLLRALIDKLEEGSTMEFENGQEILSHHSPAFSPSSDDDSEIAICSCLRGVEILMMGINVLITGLSQSNVGKGNLAINEICKQILHSTNTTSKLTSLLHMFFHSISGEEFKGFEKFGDEIEGMDFSSFFSPPIDLTNPN